MNPRTVDRRRALQMLTAVAVAPLAAAERYGQPRR